MQNGKLGSRNGVVERVGRLGAHTGMMLFKNKANGLGDLTELAIYNLARLGVKGLIP